MDYVFASYIQDMKDAWASKDNNDIIISTILCTLVYDGANPYEYSVDADTASHYMTRKRNLKREITEASTVPAVKKALVGKFQDKVVTQLDPSKTKDLVYTICYHVDHADNLSPDAKSRVQAFADGNLPQFLAYTLCVVLSVPNKKEKEEQLSAPVPQTNYQQYLANVKDAFGTAKTILHHDLMLPFYDLYVCNDICLAEQKRHSISTGIPLRINRLGSENGDAENDACNQGEILSDITAKRLLAVSNRVILRGTGGIGKSMMMRHLLLSAIADTDGKFNIPIMIPLKEFNGREDLEIFITRCICQYADDISPEDASRDL